MLWAVNATCPRVPRVKTYSLFSSPDFGILLPAMLRRSTNHKKDSEDHCYFSMVENGRLARGRTARRTVLYLGEIN